MDNNLDNIFLSYNKILKRWKVYNKTDEIIQNRIDEISSVFSMEKFGIINISFLKRIKK